MYKSLTDTDAAYQEFIDNEDILSIVSAAGTVFLMSTMPEIDPTVPSWAKEQTKPSYTYDEIKDKPDLLSLGETSGTAYDGAKGAQNTADITALKTSVAGKQDKLTDADKNALIHDVIAALPIYDGSVTEV